MRALVWILAIITFLIWSVFALISKWALGLGTEFAARNADQVPADAETIEQISELSRIAGTFGGWTIAIIWAFGSLLIYAIAKLITKWLAPKKINSPYSATLPRDDK